MRTCALRHKSSIMNTALLKYFVRPPPSGNYTFNVVSKKAPWDLTTTPSNLTCQVWYQHLCLIATRTIWKYLCQVRFCALDSINIYFCAAHKHSPLLVLPWVRLRLLPGGRGGTMIIPVDPPIIVSVVASFTFWLLLLFSLLLLSLLLLFWFPLLDITPTRL